MRSHLGPTCSTMRRVRLRCQIVTGRVKAVRSSQVPRKMLKAYLWLPSGRCKKSGKDDR